MTYTVETDKTHQTQEITQMTLLRRISEKHYEDRERSADIRTEYTIQNINEWVLNRKQEWKKYKAK